MPRIPLAYSCLILSPTALSHARTWDIHPFLPLTEPIFQSAVSIERVGLLTLPLTLQTAEGAYEFVSGSGDYRLFQQFQPDTAVWCRVLAADTPAASVLQLLYEDLASSRDVSPIELAYFYKLVQTRLPSNPEKEHLLQRLNLQTTPHFIDRTLQLLDLQPEVQRRIMQGAVPENIGRELLKLTDEDRETAVHLITVLNMGGGKQKRLLSLLRDIAGRSGRTFAELLGREEYRQIMDHPQMNTPQKTHALLQLLQERLTPRLNRAETDFAAWKSELALPEFVDLDHSLSFERDDVTVSLTFCDREQAERCLPELISLYRQGTRPQG